MQVISGKTRIVAHLAHPAGHLRTPGLFNAFCARRGLDAVLVPWQVAAEDLPAVFEGLRRVENLAGVVVTIPHKGAVASLCDRLSPTARALGVVNAARRDGAGRFHGAMFDGTGLVRGLRDQGHEVRGRRVLLIGAGAAATGIAEALLREGVECLTIANRSEATAMELVHRLHAALPDGRVAFGPADATGADLVVNGTSLGMKPDDPLPLDPATLAPGTLVVEAVMEPDMTPLLRIAGARGCVVHKGVHMITGQIGLLVDFLLGEPGA